MITARGVGFLIAAILVFFLARLSQVGWLYLVDALLLGHYSSVGPVALVERSLSGRPAETVLGRKGRRV